MKVSSLILATGLLANLLSLRPASAATLTSKSVGDVTIQSTFTNYFDASNGGGSPTLTVANYFERAALMRFDTSGFGALSGATINSVTLNFTLSSGFLSGGANFVLAQMTAANSGWVEGTGTGPGDYTAGGATLQYANKTAGSAPDFDSPGTGTAWGGGGNFNNFYTAGNQFLGNAATEYTLPPPLTDYAAGAVLSFTVSNDIITNWLANGSLALAGLAIVRNGDDGHGYAGNPLLFYSQNSGAALAPSITIDYTAVPEPGTVTLLGLGAVVALGSRRRRA